MDADGPEVGTGPLVALPRIALKRERKLPRIHSRGSSTRAYARMQAVCSILPRGGDTGVRVR